MLKEAEGREGWKSLKEDFKWKISNLYFYSRTGFEKKLAISKAGQFLSKVVPEEDKSKRK